jgi:hypothetical protein
LALVRGGGGTLDEAKRKFKEAFEAERWLLYSRILGV